MSSLPTHYAFVVITSRLRALSSCTEPTLAAAQAVRTRATPNVRLTVWHARANPTCSNVLIEISALSRTDSA
jgi:hypothetical protein